MAEPSQPSAQSHPAQERPNASTTAPRRQGMGIGCSDSENAALGVLLCDHSKVELAREVVKLRSMIAGWANGFVPACRALQREADAIREGGNDGRAYPYGE